MIDGKLGVKTQLFVFYGYTISMGDERMTQLRLMAFMRAKNKCEWAGCNRSSQLQLAHIQGKGMGGNEKRKYDPENVAVLCMYHHDIYDGRSYKNSKYEIRMLLTDYLKGKWNESRREDTASN